MMIALKPFRMAMLLCGLFTAQVQAQSSAVTVAVTNGLFTVALDFGDQVLNGADRFLQIEARTTMGPFTPLIPRQRLTAAPYAVRVRSVSSGGLGGGTYANAVTFNNAGNSLSLPVRGLGE